VGHKANDLAEPVRRIQSKRPISVAILVTSKLGARSVGTEVPRRWSRSPRLTSHGLRISELKDSVTRSSYYCTSLLRDSSCPRATPPHSYGFFHAASALGGGTDNFYAHVRDSASTLAAHFFGRQIRL